MGATGHTIERFGGAAGPRPAPAWRPLVAPFNGTNLTAGLTAGLWYTFGAIPLFLSAAADLGLSAAARSSWFFIIFTTSAVSSIVLSLRYREPIAVGWTVPGLVFLATFGTRFTLPEMAGAVLIAGLVMLVLGFLGLGERVVHWIPLPIVMGVFVGGMLDYANSIFVHLGAHHWSVGAAVAGFLGARALGRNWLPPMGGAVAAGMVAAAVVGEVHPEPLGWSPPQLVAIWPAFNPTSMLALSLPLVLITLSIGAVQGVGVLESQGYRPPTKLLTLVLGTNTVINALFGGHTAALQNNGMAMLAGPGAGPREHRYVACLVASLWALVLGLCASTAGTLLGVLPTGLVASLAGLAVVGALMDALRKVALTDLPMGAFFALAISASPLSLLGIGSAFWALVGGLGISLLLERDALTEAVRTGPRSGAI